MADRIHPQLEWRYAALFSAYGLEGLNLTQWAKEIILGHMSEEPGLLRWDGAYFLLTNLDQMIIRPYAGYIFAPPWAPISRIGTFKFESEDQVRGAVDEAIGIILDGIRSAEELPASSHAVMQQVERAWDKLSEIFRWG